MLTVKSEAAAPTSSRGSAANGRFAKASSLEWIGQTVASLCWIGSVFAIGITSAGDWLQLVAASSWLVANIAALMMSDAD